MKKSLAFADEAGVVAVVDVEVADETTGGSDGRPPATAGRVVVVIAFPGELGAGGSELCRILGDEVDQAAL